MKILILNEKNKKELEALIKETEANLKDERFWLPISEASREHYFDPNWTIFWGAFEGEKLIGAIGLFFNENEYGESQKAIKYENVNLAEAGRAMCHPKYRGTGVASKLMDELLKHSQSLDLECLLATAHPDNAPSQKLLEKYGFEKEGHIIKNENYERDILIRRMS